MKRHFFEAVMHAVMMALNCAVATIAVTWALCGGVNFSFVVGSTIISGVIGFTFGFVASIFSDRK